VPLVATLGRYRKKRMLRCGVNELVGALVFCEAHASRCVRANQRGIQARHTGRRDRRNHHAANGNGDAGRTTNHDRDNEHTRYTVADLRSADACPRRSLPGM
jgi:hypothetical protein